ncbi:TetR/AcrR family transcriptional regulator [Streptomyces purpureus]|uniref:TetR/AcrR family transcriptional regulator n=1 Tax=Streptomyces purpureus TaxID=1951 RepID=UPI000379B826|nr:TetR/AcrR family transcriptional regulator [Streptomyces purpureus]
MDVRLPPHRHEGYLPIADYGLVGDGKSCALIGRDGAVAFLCVPRFDSAPLFAALLDRHRGGALLLAPVETRCSRQWYEPGTGVLVTEMTGREGTVEVTDAFLPQPGARLEEDVPAGMGRLLRRARVTRGRVTLRVAVCPRPPATARWPYQSRGEEAGMATETRGRMLEAAVLALQRRGVAGMSFTEILRDSGAARGAIYHHFPGGKAQLVAEAATRNGQDIRVQLATLPTSSPYAVAEAFLDFARPVVEAATTGSGCAVAAVTVDPDPASDMLRQVAAIAFDSWIEQLAERLTTAGLSAGEAGDLAATLITLLEGAHVLRRASGTLEPFEQTARTALALTRSRYPSA